MGRVIGEPQTFEGKQCVKCGSTTRLASTSRCRACNKRYAVQNKASRPERDAKRGCPCDICAEPMQQPCFDEVQGKLRGWLCHNCNIALGQFRESPELLRRAAEYLAKQKHA